MNATLQRIIIAEFSDPTKYLPGTGREVRGEPIWLLQRKSGDQPTPITCADFTRDQNAINEVISRLSQEQIEEVASMLDRVLASRSSRGTTASRGATASAQDKCEALLRFLGKWEQAKGAAPLLSPFTVLLRYPDYVSGNWPDDQYVARVTAKTPQAALRAARSEAKRKSTPDLEVRSVNDFALVAIFAGHSDYVAGAAMGL